MQHHCLLDAGSEFRWHPLTFEVLLYTMKYKVWLVPKYEMSVWMAVTLPGKQA